MVSHTFFSIAECSFFFCQYMIVVLWRFHSSTPSLAILCDLSIGEHLHTGEVRVENGSGIVTEFCKIERTVLAHAHTVPPAFADNDEIIAVFRIRYFI